MNWGDILDPTIVSDTDTPFKVDPITREITPKNPKKIVLMQGDHNSERFTFDIPRYIEGRDVGLCNVVQIYYINVESRSGRQATGVYTVDDFNVYEFIRDVMSCSWLISANATKYAGSLSFMIRFAQMDGDKIKYAWNTAVFEGIRVAESLTSDEEFETEYVDVIQQWKDSVMAEFTVYVDTSVKEHVDVAQIDINKSNIAELNNDQAVLKSRMDMFSSLEEGSTTGDAELKDIRVSVNGEVYPTAGDSIRGQFKDMAKGLVTSDEFLDNQVRSHNVVDLNKAHIGYFLSTNDEIIAMSETQCYTDYIAVRTGEKYIARHPWGAQFSVSFYDEAKTLVAQQSYTEDTPVIKGSNTAITTSYWHCVTIPAGIAYMRLNLCPSPELYAMVVKGDSVDDVPTEYEAYKPEIQSEAFLRAVSEYAINMAEIVNTEDNVVLGRDALPIYDGVRYNVAIGPKVMQNILVDLETDDQSGRYNVGVGGSAMKDTTTGNHNTACGFQAMMGNTTGTANTAVGEDALMTNAAGNYNVAIGCRALQSATAGDDNVAIGQGAGYWNDTQHPTGSRNVMIGAHSGQSDGSGSDNIAIGYFAKANKDLCNTIVIGSGMSAYKSGQTIIGYPASVETIIRGDLHIIGSDGMMRKLVFNSDGTIGWIAVDY